MQEPCGVLAAVDAHRRPAALPLRPLGAGGLRPRAGAVRHRGRQAGVPGPGRGFELDIARRAPGAAAAVLRRLAPVVGRERRVPRLPDVADPRLRGAPVREVRRRRPPRRRRRRAARLRPAGGQAEARAAALSLLERMHAMHDAPPLDVLDGAAGKMYSRRGQFVRPSPHVQTASDVQAASGADRFRGHRFQFGAGLRPT
mmetsp:Transcript_18174/g.54321  ORF Transcript_18174/g.54321 Transcript_18174/m.54321 type:complete len:200 (+) Transcript_18174:822-1421(+)